MELNLTYKDSLEDIATFDGMHGVFLITLRLCKERFPQKNAEQIAILAHQSLLVAMETFVNE